MYKYQLKKTIEKDEEWLYLENIAKSMKKTLSDLLTEREEEFKITSYFIHNEKFELEKQIEKIVEKKSLFSKNKKTEPEPLRNCYAIKINIDSKNQIDTKELLTKMKVMNEDVSFFLLDSQTEKNNI